MITGATFRKIALSLPGTEEAPHFEKTSFRVNKKIFATWNPAAYRATVKLSVEEQDIFSQSPGDVIYPVPNAWGKQGWTQVDLKNIKKDLLVAVLTAAHEHLQAGKKKPAKKKL